jgi:glycosyltransferase EpsH
MPLISIIIPIYNTETFLKKCLRSVLNQTFKDIEIICVNDASTDNCLKILYEEKEKDERIKIIDFKENQGVSIARNEALNIASGKYIGFVDSDDWIDIDFYERLYEIAINGNAEIIKSATKVESNRKNFINVENYNGYYIRLLDDIEKDKFMLHNVIWNGIYKKDFIDKYKLNFAPELARAGAEDEYFNIKAGYYCNKIDICKNAVYRHCRREGSLYSNFLNEEKIKTRILLSQYLSDFLNNNLYPQKSYLKRILLTSYTLSNYFDKTNTKENKMLIVKQILKLYKEVKKEHKRNFILDVNAKDYRLYKYLESEDEQGLYNLLLKKSKNKIMTFNLFNKFPILNFYKGNLYFYNTDIPFLTIKKE